jgi:hypothetical protein
MHRTLTAEEADELLRKPVLNKGSVQRALGAASSCLRNSFMSTHSLREAMFTYPYLKETDLVSWM